MKLLVFICIVSSLAPIVLSAGGGGISTFKLPADEPTFPMIAAANASGQWAIKPYIRSAPDWTLVTNQNCPSPVYGYCFNANKPAPFNTPLLVLSGDAIKIDYVYNNKTSINFFGKSKVPTSISFRMCYSNVAFTDRAWRKKNKAYPKWTDNCNNKMTTFDFPAVADPNNMTEEEIKSLSGTFTFTLDHGEMATASYFFMMWVFCADGRVCAFTSTESKTDANGKYGALATPSGYNGVYVEVQSYNPVTPGLVAACAVLSAIGPLFFIVYVILDNRHYARTGKPLVWN